MWGSPLFHWSLVLVMLAVVLGALQSSYGLDGTGGGPAEAQHPRLLRTRHAGPLHDWNGVQQSIRVDSMVQALFVDGLDRGPSPTVSVLDGSGKVQETQQVYPNHPLKTGGSASTTPTAACPRRLPSSTATARRGAAVHAGGLRPRSCGRDTASELLQVRRCGRWQSRRWCTSLSRSTALGAEFNDWIPQERKARIVAVDPEGQSLVDRVVSPGETVALPSGSAVRLDSVDSYARLTVSKDNTIPLVYASMILAIVFLSVTLFARQQLVLAAVVDGEQGPTFVARIRLWRNVATSASEVRRRLEDDLEAAHGGNTE